jgi:hypothetical protein
MTLVTSTPLTSAPTSNSTSPPTPSPIQQIGLELEGPVSKTNINVYQTVDRECGLNQMGIVSGKPAPGITGGVTQVTRGWKLSSKVEDGEIVEGCLNT